MESSDFLFDGAEVRVTAIISLDVGVNSPILGLLELFNDEGIGVGVSLDMTKEPGWERLGDVIIVDAGGGVEVLDENGVIGASSCAHDSTLVDIFDVTGLHGKPVDDNGEVRHLSAVFFKPLWALDCIGVLIRTEAMLEVFNSGLAASSDGVEVGAVFGLLRRESVRKSMIPSCLGCSQGLVDMLLSVVSLLSKSGNEGLVSVFVIDGVAQFPDSRASDVLGQGSNGLDGESVFPVIDEGEGTLGIDDGDFGELQNLGRHLEINRGSKHFAIFERVIG